MNAIAAFDFPPPPEAPGAEALRREVRAFLKEELADYPWRERALSWTGFSAEFSRRLGEKGWIAMTWPKEWGGHERSALDRYVVMEELLAHGAPVAAHWISDRQSGPLIMRVGTEEQKKEVLPAIARGECYFCIGMSEPGSGSDLAAVRTKAVPEDGGFRINGTKLWTTWAHRCHYMILFCRTDGGPEDRHKGVSQLLIDLRTPGITIRPIKDLTGGEHFNEVTFEDVFVPESAILGTRGDGWNQVTSELAFERSGPERFLSSMALLTELIGRLSERSNGDERAEIAIGRLSAHLMALRRLSRSVSGMLQRGENPALQASLVKDVGAEFEQSLPEIARLLVEAEPDKGARDEYAATLAETMLSAPSYSLRGGTREILRGIIARGLGLR